MSQFEAKVVLSPTDKYEKARQDALNAKDSIGQLSQEQKERLIMELLGAQALEVLREMAIRHRWNW